MLPPPLLAKLQTLRQQNKKIVLVTGVFDILHAEHQAFLGEAKKLGDFLLVGIESDVRVRKLKGEGRPVNSQDLRVHNLLNWQIADEVFILPEQFSSPQDHEDLIALIQPSFLAVSAHTPHQAEKKRLVEKYGGELRIVLEHNPEISTTKILAEGVTPPASPESPRESL